MLALNLVALHGNICQVTVHRLQLIDRPSSTFTSVRGRVSRVMNTLDLPTSNIPFSVNIIGNICIHHI